ncbi:MAG: hypothetical protein AB7F50_05090 [Fimbriimonadaceae bacterium]
MDSATRGGLRFVSLMVDATSGVDVEPFRVALGSRGLASTFWVDPSRLVERPEYWRKFVAEGHEVANGTFLDAAGLDGRLDRWTLAMVNDELAETKKLWFEVFGTGASQVVAVPFGERAAHDGDYLDHLVGLGVTVCASSLANGIAVWPARSTQPDDLTAGMIHAVHLTRAADNRPYFDETVLNEWASWAAGLPKGIVATVSHALGHHSASQIAGT